MTVDPYLDPSTGVLINKLGITDAETLQQVVADVSAARLDQLAAQPLPGVYDLAHLREFHKIIFGDVFAWAGQIRTVQISKETGFCLPQHIESYGSGEFVKLARDGYLRYLLPSSGSSPPKPDISSVGAQLMLRTTSALQSRHTGAI